MSYFETVYLLLVIIAVVISVVSLIRTRRVQGLQVELQKKQTELMEEQNKLKKDQAKMESILANHQIQDYEQARQAKSKADIDVALRPGRARGTYQIVLSNQGGAAAQNVNLAIRQAEGAGSPLVQGDYDKKLPIPRLDPGKECPLLAALSHQCYPPFNVRVSWDDPDGTPRTKDQIIYD